MVVYRVGSCTNVRWTALKASRSCKLWSRVCGGPHHLLRIPVLCMYSQRRSRIILGFGRLIGRYLNRLGYSEREGRIAISLLIERGFRELAAAPSS